MITSTRQNSPKHPKLGIDKGIAALQTAAEAKDELAFLKARKAIQWEKRPAEDFVHAVQLALLAGAFVAARNLAQEGTERYPSHVELTKMARILALPKVTVVPGKINTSWKANREWLKTHWNEYQGQWVALKSGELLGADDSLDALTEQIGEIKETGILIAPIYRSNCFCP